MKKLLLIVGVVAVVGFGLWAWQSENRPGADNAESEKPTDDPIDVVTAFYNDWLTATKATDTDPVAAGLLNADVLREAVRTTLENPVSVGEVELDPVLCQASVPEKIGAKLVSETDARAQVLVIARGTKMPGQAQVTLVLHDGKWVIEAIDCSYGEAAPSQGEFSFEQTGQLLKGQAVLPDSEHWYLVYEDSGMMGFTAKLLFDGSSMCIADDGSESVCDENTFEQTATAFVQGDASETGINVKRLELK